MNGYSGSISIYFPCKLKPWASMRRLNNRLRRWQQRQVRYIHHSNAPLTDLMDKEQNKNIMDSFLSLFQRTVAREFDIDENRSPFGLECLRLAYRKNREDNLFSKNVQIVLSRFSMEYNIRNRNQDRMLESEGVLLLNINADNRVATLVVTLNFKKYDVLKLVYLKHIFFKRLLVSITEYDTSIEGNCSTCGGFGCFRERGRHFYGRMTIQEFVNNRSREILSRRELAYDVDYRARYSFIELTEPPIKLVAKLDEHEKLIQKTNVNLMQELYGIMMSDEGYTYLPTDKLFEFFRNNYSTRSGYDLFLSGLNAMIVTRNMDVRSQCQKEHISFEEGYDEPQENIQAEPILGDRKSVV